MLALLIIEDALAIDEVDVLKEELITNNVRTDLPNAHVACEGVKVRKASLLKHAINGTICPKSLDRMKRAAGFSHYKNGNITAVARATNNVFIEDENIYLSEGDSVVFVGKCKNSIINANDMWISIFIGR